MATNPTGRGVKQADLSTAPMYEVVKRAVYANGAMNPIGSRIRFLGVPGSNLEPLDAAGKAIKAKAAALRKAEYKGDDATERNAARNAALRDYDDQLRGINDYADDAGDDELSAKERAPLIAAAEQTAKDTEAAQQADSNFVKVKLQGEADPAPNELQGKPVKK